jgi:alcohol dehydrogenase (cytochrome c)
MNHENFMRSMLTTRYIPLALCIGVAVFLPAQSSYVGWTTYHGQYFGNRYSTLTAINTGNVSGLRPIVSFKPPSANNPSGLETTPLVSGSTMFLTSTNSVYAYDLANGQSRWSFQRAPSPGVVQDAGSGYNRGVAMSSDSIFLATDNAHLLSLNRTTGALQWETTVADYSQNYGITAAPLYLPGPNLVVTGVSGGDSGIRGFLAAYNAGNSASNNNQAPVWKFYTTPGSLSDPGGSTWGSGAVLPHGCGATWTTGTYDSAANILYWGVGNPCRDFNGDDREGDNLYTSSVLALNPSSTNPGGELLWYFQFTPHGLWDADGANVPMLANASWQGAARNLLFHANRNGFFYVLDRGTGEYLAGFPFVNNLTWATGLDATGRPVVNPAAIPTTAGTMACPPVSGATNWGSSAFSPNTSLFYVQALEYCNVYTKGPLRPWKAGYGFDGGYTGAPPGMTPQKYVYAFNPLNQRACPQTSCPLSLAWSYPEAGSKTAAMGGVLATAGGLVFVAEDSGALSALDASNGNLLWTHTVGNQTWKSSPMTYLLDGKQYVAIATPGSVVVYGL